MKKRDSFYSILAAFLIAFFLWPILKGISQKGSNAGSLKIFFNYLNNYYLIIFFVLPILSWLFFYLLFLLKLDKKRPSLWQISKFAEVGVLNTFVDWGVLNILMLLTGIVSGGYYLIFKGFSASLAIINSYVFNKIWVFEDKKQKALKEFSVFVVISFIGVVINIIIAHFVVDVFGPHFGIKGQLWANIGAFFATLFSMIWNFIGYKFVVFKS